MVSPSTPTSHPHLVLSVKLGILVSSGMLLNFTLYFSKVINIHLNGYWLSPFVKHLFMFFALLVEFRNSKKNLFVLLLVYL